MSFCLTFHEAQTPIRKEPGTKLMVCACNTPIESLYENGTEIDENPEPDLLVAYKTCANAPTSLPRVLAGR